MSKGRETKYLFSKMESVEDGIEHTIRVEEKSVSTDKDSTTIYHFDESGKTNAKPNNWMKNNIMLISTLGAVIFGVSTGKNFLISYVDMTSSLRGSLGDFLCLIVH